MITMQMKHFLNRRREEKKESENWRLASQSFSHVGEKKTETTRTSRKKKKKNRSKIGSTIEIKQKEE